MAVAVSGSTTNVVSSTSPATIGFTASASLCVILAIMCWEQQAGAAPTVSGVTDTNTLSWAKRGSVSGSPLSNGNNVAIELWWAYSAATYNGTISFAATGGGSSYDDATLIAIAVAGANTSTPFDTNGSLPGTGVSNGTPAEATVSTSIANDLLLAIICSDSNPTPGGQVPSGLTLIASQLNGGGSAYCYGEADGLVLSGTISSTAVGWSSGVSSGTGLGYYVDAIAPPGGGPAFLAPAPYIVNAAIQRSGSR